MDYGITDDGFNRKPREEIVSDMRENARIYFGNDINLNNNSPLGMIIKLVSYAISLLWRALEGVYNSSYINTATGQSLDYLAKYIGISRKDSTQSSGQVDFYGDEGVSIPEGFLVETDSEDPIQFETIESGTIPSEGNISLNVESVESGEHTNVIPDEVTVIVNPISGLDSVTNPFEIDGGTDVESDYELRERYKQSVALPGTSTIESIRSTILNITKVRNASIKENYTLETDENGIPGKSFELIVVGGDDDDIAEAIFETKPAGIKAYGDINIDIEDSGGNIYTIGFSRPEEISIYVDVDITTNNEYPSTGDILVETEIIKYIGGIDANNVDQPGLNVAEDVIYNKLIDVLYNVDGVEDVSLTVGTTDNPTGTSNISIGDYEIAQTSVSNVDVNS